MYNRSLVVTSWASFGSSGFSAFGHVGTGAKHPVPVQTEVTCGQCRKESHRLSEKWVSNSCARNGQIAGVLLELRLDFLSTPDTVVGHAQGRHSLRRLGSFGLQDGDTS